jgi:endonuclease/exonuclease/phosphatase family metal-dependent hydrolase
LAHFRVMTFNINGNDYGISPENEWKSWANRANLSLKTIQRYSPNLIGLQEVTTSNIEYYRQHLADYDFELGQEYDEGVYAAYSSILWKRARFELVESGKIGSAERLMFAPATGVCLIPWGLLGSG